VQEKYADQDILRVQPLSLLLLLELLLLILYLIDRQVALV
jgi:hypothetical protein